MDRSSPTVELDDSPRRRLFLVGEGLLALHGRTGRSMGTKNKAKTTLSALNPVLMHILRVGRERFQGILILRSRGGSSPPLHLRLIDGLLVDLETEGKPSLLSRALLASPQLRDKERRRFRKEEAAGQGDTGQLIIASGLLDEQEIARSILAGLDDELSQFLDMKTPEVIEAGDSDLVGGFLGCVDLNLPLEEALLRSAASRNRWDIARELPLLREVFGATSQAMELFRQAEHYPDEARILQTFDGQLDLAEVIEATKLDSWSTLSRCRDLLDAGYLQSTNPVQLFQFATEEEQRGHHEKAMRLFQHAEELGLDDFDLGHRLAQAFQRVGRTAEALGFYHRFAEKCVSQFRIEETIGVYQRILEINPNDLVIHERYLNLLARHGRGEEALRGGIELAQKLQQLGDESRAHSLLEKLIEHGEGCEELLRLYRDLSLKTADPEGAVTAARKLGELYLERQDFPLALEVYQGLFQQLQDDPEIRARLAELHFRTGHLEKAREHLEALQRRAGWESRQPSAEAIAFHRRLLEFGMEDATVTAWLAEAAQSQESRADSAHYLLRHRNLLSESGDLEGARQAALELCRLRPDDLEAVRAWSDLERRCGADHRAALALEEFATRAKENGMSVPESQWRDFLKELLSIQPLSQIGQALLLEAIGDQGEPALRDQLLLQSALTSLIRGDIEHSRTQLARLSSPPPLSPVLELCAGIFCLGGQEQKRPADSWFRRGAQQAAEQGDRSLLEDLIARLEVVAPDDAEAAKLRNTAERLKPVEGSGMSRSPKVVKSGIAGITEKLRGFKEGDSGTPQAVSTPSPPSPPSGGGIQSALARLKGLKGNPASPTTTATPPVASGTPASTASESPNPPIQVAPEGVPPAGSNAPDLPAPPSPTEAGGGVSAALARLKGLQSPAENRSVPEIGSPAQQSEVTTDQEDREPLPPPPAPQNAGGGVNAALARLKGLQTGNPTTASTTAPATPDSSISVSSPPLERTAKKVEPEPQDGRTAKRTSKKTSKKSAKTTTKKTTKKTAKKTTKKTAKKSTKSQKRAESG